MDHFRSTGRALIVLSNLVAIVAVVLGTLGLLLEGLLGMMVGALGGALGAFVLLSPLVLLLAGTADAGRAINGVIKRRHVIRTRQRDARSGLLSVTNGVTAGELSDPVEGALSGFDD